jgi:hypothetical protein
VNRTPGQIGGHSIGVNSVSDKASTHPNEAAFPAGLSGPALRALARARIRSMSDLMKWSEADLAKLHGMGPKAIQTLKAALAEQGQQLRED